MIAPSVDGLIQVAGVAALGGGIGSVIAKKIEITDLPQLVAAFHRYIFNYEFICPVRKIHAVAEKIQCMLFFV